MYHKFKEKSLPSYTTNIFQLQHVPAIIIYRSPKVLQMLTPKQLAMINVSVINETDKDVMDKIATHSYQDFAFYFKRVTIRKDNQNCHIHKCYVCKSHSTEKFITLYNHLLFPYVHL